MTLGKVRSVKNFVQMVSKIWFFISVGKILCIYLYLIDLFWKFIPKSTFFVVVLFLDLEYDTSSPKCLYRVQKVSRACHKVLSIVFETSSCKYHCRSSPSADKRVSILKSLNGFMALIWLSIIWYEHRKSRLCFPSVSISFILYKSHTPLRILIP